MCTEGGVWYKTGLEKGKEPSAWFSRTYGQNNPKTSNPGEIWPFEYAAPEKRT